MSEELLKEEDVSLLSLTDDDGNEVEFELLDCVDYQGSEYLILLPPGEEASEVVILEVEIQADGSESYLSVVDEHVLRGVYQIFKERFRDLLSFEDDESQGECIDIEQFSILKLNKQNVLSTFRECLATADTPKDHIWSGHFFSQESKRTAPSISFNHMELAAKIPIFQYWAGQLKVIHQRRNSFTMAQGMLDYTGNKWTDDNNAVLAFYYLAVVSLTLPYFTDGENSAEMTNMELYYKTLPPTYAPEDSRFDPKVGKEVLTRVEEGYELNRKLIEEGLL